jgi:hypothetical protein
LQGQKQRSCGGAKATPTLLAWNFQKVRNGFEQKVAKVTKEGLGIGFFGVVVRRIPVRAREIRTSPANNLWRLSLARGEQARREFEQKVAKVTKGPGDWFFGVSLDGFLVARVRFAPARRTIFDA